jgi:predicted SprT family Zn-dependent metalloprotease
MTISTLDAVGLGKLMCAVTDEILWGPAAEWVQTQNRGSHLVCRVGSGQATYHRYEPKRKQHQITYGKRMILDKFQPDRASGWLSSREIRQRGYFEGQVTTLNLLAHTCCHEFAHLLQQVSGKRYRGSVHNRDFYTILDQLHQSGGAQETRRQLAATAEKADMPMPHKVMPELDEGRPFNQWSRGDRVGFMAGKKPVEGKVIRVNPKTCTIEGVGVSRGMRYRVPPRLLYALRNG